jgi:hypothetical protein
MKISYYPINILFIKKFNHQLLIFSLNSLHNFLQYKYHFYIKLLFGNIYYCPICIPKFFKMSLYHDTSYLLSFIKATLNFINLIYLIAQINNANPYLSISQVFPLLSINSYYLLNSVIVNFINSKHCFFLKVLLLRDVF